MNSLILEVNSNLDGSLLNDLKSHLQAKFNDSSIQLEPNSFTNQITTSMQSPETKRIILEQKILSYGAHILIATENGYKNNETYQQNDCMLIFRNIENDDLIVKLYAEHLQPDSDVISVVASKCMPNTFFIRYTSNLDAEMLNKRYDKKPKLGERKIEVLNSFQTNSLIVWPANIIDLKVFDLFAGKIFWQVFSKHKYILVHFINYEDMNKFVQMNGLSMEQVFNFEMFNSLYIETLNVLSERKSDLNSVTKVQDTKKLVKSTVSKRSLAAVAASVVKISNLLFFKKIDMTPYNFDPARIIKMELNNVFHLNENEPMVIGLLNSSQLLVDLNLNLININHECIIESNDKGRKILIRLKKNVQSDSQFEVKNNLIIESLAEFYEKNFIHQIYELNDEFQSIPGLDGKLKDQCIAINKRFTAVHLKFEKFLLFTYGSLNSLSKVLRNLESFMKTIKNSNLSVNKSSNNTKVIFSSFIKSSQLKSASSLSSKDSLNKIDFKIYPVLKKSLLNCHKIFVDFKEDLKAIEFELVTNENEFEFEMINSKKNGSLSNLNRLLFDYESKKLSQEFIKIDENFNSKDNLEVLLKTVSDEEEINDLKQIMNTFYKSDKVVHVQLNENKEFEVYGYSKAMQGFSDYLRKRIDKAVTKILNQNQSKLEFTLKVPNELSCALFNYFDGKYLDDLIIRLRLLDAFAVNLGNNNSVVVIGCLNNNLKKKKLNLTTSINEWRSNVENFLKAYVEQVQFCSETILMPFSRTDQEAIEFLYDKNSLYIKWISEMNIEVFGLKSEINELKKRIK